MGSHIAVKCTYCDGDEGEFVGFNGTCSDLVIAWNIRMKHRVWCSDDDCNCKKYYDRGFRGPRPVDACYESALFRDWKYCGGFHHSGKSPGKPIYHDVSEGNIAVLTTRFRREDTEDRRRIVGFFKIAKVDYPDGGQWLWADKHFRVRLRMEEARELLFWDYYSNQAGKEDKVWITGLTRYLSAEQTADILRSLKETLHDEKRRDIVANLLRRDFQSV